MATAWLSWLGWQALWTALVALPVALADLALGHRLPALRWSLWNLVLVRLVVPVDLSAPWGFGRLAELGDRPLPAPAEAVGALALLPGARSPTAAADPASGAEGWALAAVLVWALGAALSAAAWLRGRRRHRRLLASAEPARDGWLEEHTTAWQRRLGVTRRVAVVVSVEAVQPCTLGVLRPVVCLPRSLLARGRPEVSAVLGHEIAHVRRLDDLALRWEAALGALFWFHPGVGWARRRLEAVREELCDAAAVAAGEVSRAVYARTLLALASASPEGRGRDVRGVTAGWSVAPGRRRLAERVRAVLDPSACGRSGRWVAVGAAAGLLLLPMAPAPAAGEPAPSDPAGAAATPRPETGHWLHPAPGARLTSGFGVREDPFTGQVSHHDGVDLAAPRGTPVRAAADGMVRTASRRYQPALHHGIVVEVEHPSGEISFYSHLADLAVAEGDPVAAGQILGGMGTTGEVTGPHLHFELWRNGQPVDPLSTIPGGPK